MTTKCCGGTFFIAMIGLVARVASRGKQLSGIVFGTVSMLCVFAAS